MKKTLLLLITTLCASLFSFSREDKSLFSIGNTKVLKSEFEYIYQKNNFNNKADYSKKSIENYLDLYINFRLKVKEALSQNLDKNDRFVEELASYEKQLLESYTDKEVLDKLIKQEFERSKKDVNVSHIFVSTKDINEKEANLKIQELQKKIKDGTTFEEVAKLSDDKKSATKGGNLGWFNSYQIVFPEIEDVAYSLNVGEISPIIKTRLGYHIIKLYDSRIARPRLKVSIIKKYFSITDSSETAKKIVADSMQIIYGKLKNGESFEKIVDLYSEDDFSKTNKGQLDWFGINTYSKIFEETAYSLKDGEISTPFRTSTSMYIIKRLETSKDLSFEESIPLLKVKLQAAPQYQSSLNKYVERLKTKWNVKELTQNIPAFRKRIEALSATLPFVYRDTTPINTLLQIGDKKYTETEYGKKVQEDYFLVTTKYGENRYDALVNHTTQNFILEYNKNDIKLNNEEFKLLMDEYKNGIMIFNLSEKNIWNKASDDTIGLAAFYNSNKGMFDLKKRATLRTITLDNAKQAKAIAKILKTDKSITDEMLSSKIKTFGISEQRVKSILLEEGKNDVVITNESISTPVIKNTKYVITQQYNILPEKKRAFDECRGYVVAAYQEYLEKEWLKELKKKYPININESVLDEMIKK